MGKRGGGKLGRRTVLQIDEDVKRQPTYGFGYKPQPDSSKEGPYKGLGGLIAEYGGSDDNDSDNSEEEKLPPAPPSLRGAVPRQAFVSASDPGSPPLPPLPEDLPLPPTNGESKLPKSILKYKGPPKSILKAQKKENTKPKDDVSKEEKQETKPKASDEVDEKLKDFLAEIDALDHAPDGDTVDEASNQGDKLEDVDGQPMTPPALTGNEETEEEWEEVTDNSDDEDPEPVPPKEPTTAWQHCLDEGTQYYYYWNVSTNQVTWEIPESYSQFLLQKNEYEALMVKYKNKKKDWEERKKNKPKKKKKVLKKKQPKKTIAPPPPPPPPPQEPTTAMTEASTAANLKESTEKAPISEKAESKKSKKEGKKKEGKKTKRSKDSEQENIVVGPQLPPIGPQLPLPPSASPPSDKKIDDDDDDDDDEGRKIVTKSVDDIAKTDNENDDDFIHQQLEGPVFTHYEYVNKKIPEVTAPSKPPGVTQQNDDTFEMDLEDIDRELEMALEKKKEAGVEIDGQRVQQAPGKKRSFAGLTEESQAKRKKLSAYEETKDLSQMELDSESSNSRRLLRNDIKVKVDALAEASELANLVIDKLDFLEVNRGGLSDLQVLLIQLETRIEDWKKGGLNTDYLLIRLRHADNELQKYEANAAPPGWSCNWDRSFKKYFYFNDVTGESQWEYPMDYGETEQKVIEEHSIDQSDEKLDGCPTESCQPVNNEVEMPGQETPVTESTNRSLDFAELAQAPPPPPGEPPPPGTEPFSPESLKQPALSNLIGYDESSSSSPESTSSHDERRERRHSSSSSSSDEKSSDDDDGDKLSVKSDNSIKPEGDYDPTDPTSEEIIAGENVQLPVHSKPVHIVAQPVIMKSAQPEEGPSSSAQVPAPDSIPPESTNDENGCLEATDAAAHVENGESEISGTASQEKPATSSEVSGAPEVTAAVKDVKTHNKEKKKKKDKSLTGGGLSMKKKGVSSLVQKWQKVQKDVETQSKRKPPPLEEGEIQ